MNLDLTDDEIATRAARIARVLDVSEKRAAIEEAFALLDVIIRHEIEGDGVMSRVHLAHRILGRHVGRTTVPVRLNNAPLYDHYEDERA